MQVRIEVGKSGFRVCPEGGRAVSMSGLEAIMAGEQFRCGMPDHKGCAPPFTAEETRAIWRESRKIQIPKDANEGTLLGFMDLPATPAMVAYSTAHPRRAGGSIKRGDALAGLASGTLAAATAVPVTPASAPNVPATSDPIQAQINELRNMVAGLVTALTPKAKAK